KRYRNFESLISNAQKRGGACGMPLLPINSIPVRLSEFELERELEVALQVGAEVGGRVDDTCPAAWIEFASAEAADESIGVAQVAVVEEVDGLDPDFTFASLGELELLEERGVSAPVPRATQRVALLVAKRPDSRGAEDAQISEVTYIPAAVTARASLDLAVDV